MSKDYILIATDLEPDDITFLRISLKGLNNKINEVQKVHILVGEGNISQAKINKVKEILKVAVADNILNPEFLERIEVLGGSSAKENSDTMHTLYNKLFFNVASDPENDSTIIEESRGAIKEAIKKAPSS